jgi:hypothetical protein
MADAAPSGDAAAAIEDLRAALSRAEMTTEDRGLLAAEIAELLASRYETRVAAGSLDAAKDDLREIVSLLDIALSSLGPDHPHHPGLAAMAGSASYELWTTSSEPGARDRAIDCFRIAASQMPDADPGLPAVLAQLALLFGSRSEEAGSVRLRVADLNAAIGYARRGLALAETQHPAGPPPESPDIDVVAELHRVAGLALADRFQTARHDLAPDDTAGIAAARADRDEAAAHLDSAAGLLSPDDQDWPSIASTRGQLLHDRYTDEWPGAAAPDPADLGQALSLLQAAAEREPAPLTLLYLVLALADRAADSEEVAVLDELISRGEQLLAHPDASPDDAPTLHDLVGEALAERAAQVPSGAHADLTGAIAHWEAELALLAADDPGRALVQAQLARAYTSRLAGDASRYDEVDRMTSHAVASWRSLPADDDLLVEVGLYAVAGLHERLRRPTQSFDRSAADTALEILLRLEPRVSDDPELHLIVAVELGHFFVGRGQATGNAADLTAAQPWVTQALAAMPADAARFAEERQTLASSLFTLAALGMSLGHLEHAIRLLRVQVEQATADVGIRAMTRSALGLAYVQLASYTQDGRDLETGIDHLRAAFDATPAGDAHRLAVAWNLGSALLTRFMSVGDRQDRDAARFYLNVLDDIGASPAADLAAGDSIADLEVTRTAMRGLLRLAEGLDGDPAALDDAARGLRSAVSMLPAEHPYQHRLRGDLGLALAMRASLTGDRLGHKQAADELMAALAAMPQDDMMRPFLLMRAGAVMASAAAADRDSRRLRAAIDYLTTALSQTGQRFGGRARLVATLGTAWEQLHRLTGDPDALEAAAHWLNMACDDLSRQQHPEHAACLMRLAHVRHAQGRLADAGEHGLAALRARGREVLLQTGTSRGLRSAGLAAAEAVDVAEWWLGQGRTEEAVAALELGRGLLLHAATSTASVADLLTLAGHADLAAQWRDGQAVPRPSPWDLGTDGSAYAGGLLAGEETPDLPSDLRARALAALSGGYLERLLAPPRPADIATALKATRADVLVYLLEARNGQPGRAIAVRAVPAARADGAAAEAPELITLPPARGDGTLDEFLAARAGASLRADRGGAEDVLRRVCTWAWDSVVSHLLDWAAAAGRSPVRVVLVPVGKLSVVPWHAACTDAGRYACAEAVISYAASARQLIDVSRRGMRDVGERPVIVGNPALDLAYAGVEAQAIRDRLYPHAVYLGHAAPAFGRPADGQAEPEDVLRQLPSDTEAGASMIHLACHAVAVGTDPGRSHLVLAERRHLPLELVLRRASGRQETVPGGLVCLAACESDLASGHYDEALTLATAFLAAGAATVVGTRWEVPEGRTALLMFMFHHFLAEAGESPRDALRRAQLWMLDPRRVPPTGMPAHLAADAERADLADLTAWGAVTHQGR